MTDPGVADWTQNFSRMILGGNFFPVGRFKTGPYVQTGTYLPNTFY